MVKATDMATDMAMDMEEGTDMDTMKRTAMVPVEGNEPDEQRPLPPWN